MRDDEKAQSYPLQWPAGRTRTYSRARALFHVRKTRHLHKDSGGGTFEAREEIPVGRARDAVLAEIERLGGRDPVISSNVRVRLDGLMSGTARPEGGDPGVAVYFILRKQRMAFANDRWDRVADNLWAIAKSIEAIRGLERWGTGEMVAAALKGYRALPPPQRPWRMVLGYGSEVRPLLTEVERRYQEQAKLLHPDRGGDSSSMAELNAARDDARAELGS